MITRIALYDKDEKHVTPVCPFGERDLAHDECYSGMGKNRCPYFVKYHHYFSGEILPEGKSAGMCVLYYLQVRQTEKRTLDPTITI